VPSGAPGGDRRRERQHPGDISGVKVAQAFNRAQANTERFRERNAANRDANVGAVGGDQCLHPVMDILGTLATAIVALYGGWLALASPPR